MAGYGSYEATVHALEHALSNGPYICGEQFTAADVYVGSSIGWATNFGLFEKRPALPVSDKLSPKTTMRSKVGPVAAMVLVANAKTSKIVPGSLNGPLMTWTTLTATEPSAQQGRAGSTRQGQSGCIRPMSSGQVNS